MVSSLFYVRSFTEVSLLSWYSILTAVPLPIAHAILYMLPFYDVSNQAIHL